MPTTMPAQWVRAGHAVPAVCSRHGQPETNRSKMVIESAAPGWTYALIPLGLLIFLIVRSATRKTVVAPAWPFCDRCKRRRAVAFGIASAILASGAVMIYADLRANRSDTHWLLLSGLIVLIIGYVALHWSRRAVIARARVTQDGYGVEVRGAAAEFETQLNAAYAAAHEARQQAPHQHGHTR